ncbi:MAG: patatin-like phospholipase family protein [Bdellovibrionales bacterium]
MAIKSSFYWRLALSSVLFLVGCQSKPKKTATTPRFRPPQVGQNEAPRPMIGEEEPDEEPQTPPPPAPETPKKVAVILGPGGAKTFAHVGVLKIFQQQRIPIHKVIGLEWGALIGGIYASKGQVNDLEWKLYKMDQLNLPYPKGLFSKKPGEETVKVMSNYLKDVFGRDDVTRARVTFSCPTRSVWSGVVAWQSKGPFSDVVRRCLPYPPTFKVQGSFVAGASQVTDAIDRLAKEGYNVIIFVNVLGSAMPVDKNALVDNLNNVILWQEVKRNLAFADAYGIETVTVDTSEFSIMNFEHKKDLVSLGERVGQQAAQKLIEKYHF